MLLHIALVVSSSFWNMAYSDPQIHHLIHIHRITTDHYETTMSISWPMNDQKQMQYKAVVNSMLHPHGMKNDVIHKTGKT